MIKIKKQSWLQVTISEHDRIKEIVNSDISDVEKDVALIALMAEVPENEIWNLPIDEVRKLRVSLAWVEREANVPKDLTFKKMKVGEWDCEVLQDLSKMTYAQFVDFQQYIADLENKKAEILSVFLIPKGHKYGDGYDIVQLQKDIRDNVSVLVFKQVWFFFLRLYTDLLGNLACSLAYKMQARAYLMRKKNPLREKYLMMARLLKQVPSTLG